MISPPLLKTFALPFVVATAVFLVAVPWGGILSRKLRDWGIGKHILADGPESHQTKSGTPTMGGIMILAPVALVLVILVASGRRQMWLPLGLMVAYGAMGAYDDFAGLRDDRGVGWLARYKLPWQIGIGLVASVVLYCALGQDGARLPGTDKVWRLGWLYIPVATLVIVGTVNGVNLADGLDGLAGGTTAIAFGAYGVIAGWEYISGAGLAGDAIDKGALATLAFALIGALAAFLWHNVYPARLFMGDVGSLALGSFLGIIALMSGWWLALPLIGIVFLAEVASDILQVGYFKYTRRKYGAGRRIFRMAPLHYHFELGGWPEVQITLRFWLVGLLAAFLGIAIVLR